MPQNTAPEGDPSVDSQNEVAPDAESSQVETPAEEAVAAEPQAPVAEEPAAPLAADPVPAANISAPEPVNEVRGRKVAPTIF